MKKPSTAHKIGLFALVAVFGLVFGCSSLRPADVAESPEACLLPKLALLESAYVREAQELCRPYTWVTCPDRRYLIDKYDAERAALVRECL